MDKTLIPSPVQYIVAEDGQRVGVVLGWEDYQELQATFPTDPDLLIGLDQSELQGLAEGILTPQYQKRLNELLHRNREEELSTDEEHELNRLLERLDSLNILKARARYTLQQLYKEEEHKAPNR